LPKQLYHVNLTTKERKALLDIVKKGSASAKTIMHANVLLAADENNQQPKRSENEIAEMFNVHSQTVHSIRKEFSLHGLEAALSRKKRETPPVPAKITGDVEAKIIALSCSEPPEGRSRWTLRLLADKAIELNYVDSISHVAIGNLLKKTN